MKPKVLIIDDEEAIRQSLQMMFEYEGYDCLQAAGGAAGLKIIDSYQPDLIFLDIKMPQMDGLEVLKEIMAREGAPPALRGHGTAGRLMEGIVERARAEGFKITPTCSYAHTWFRRHTDAQDVLA